MLSQAPQGLLFSEHMEGQEGEAMFRRCGPRGDRLTRATFRKNTVDRFARGRFPLPRYFFHLVDTSERILDPDGVELADDAAALVEATQAVRELLDEDPDQTTWHGWSFQVVDQAGLVVVPLDLANINLH